MDIDHGPSPKRLKTTSNPDNTGEGSSGNMKLDDNEDNEENEDISGLLNLPYVALQLILKKLDLSGKIAVRQTCPYLAHLAMNHMNLRPVLNDTSIDTVLAINYPFTSLKATDLKISECFLNGVPKFPDLVTTLDIQPNSETRDTMSAINFYKILLLFENVTDLTISANVLKKLSFCHDCNIKIENVESLKITFLSWQHRGSWFETLTQLKFGNLAHLDINMNDCFNFKFSSAEYESITNFICKHAGTLKFLKIIDKGCMWRAMPIMEPKPEVLEEVSKMKLKSLELAKARIQYDEFPAQWIYLSHLIGGQEYLKKLIIDFPVGDLLPNIRKALAQCSKSLESFTLVFGERDRSKFDCTWLSSIANLKRLDLSTHQNAINLHLMPSSIEELVWNAPISHIEMTMFKYLPKLSTLDLGPWIGELPNSILAGFIEHPKLRKLDLGSADSAILLRLLSLQVVAAQRSGSTIPPTRVLVNNRFRSAP